MRFSRSTLLLIPDSLNQSSVGLYPSNRTVFISVVTSKKVFVTTSLHDLEKKIKEVSPLDVAGSILVQKYHAEFGEAVDVDHYTEISNGDKLQVIVEEAKPTCSLPVRM